MQDPYPQPVYFIGIALPASLDASVSKLKWQIHDADKHTLTPLQPHVTLLNPPSLRGIMPSELLPRVREVAAHYLPLTLAIQDIGFFGKSVCYLSIQSQSIYSLQSQLVRLLPPEAQELHYKRPYLPHITIAQSYDPSTLDAAKLRQLMSDAITIPQQFTVDSVACFTRILPREYRAEAV